MFLRKIFSVVFLISFLVSFAAAQSLVITQQESYSQKIEKAQKLYDADNTLSDQRFEDNAGKNQLVIKALQDVRDNKEFKELLFSEQAEWTHRLGYAQQTACLRNLLLLNQRGMDKSSKVIQELENLNAIASLAKEAMKFDLEAKGRLSKERKRSANLLNEASYYLCFHAILLQALDPAQLDVSNRFKKIAMDHLAWYISHVPADADDDALTGTRYIGKGLFVFEQDNKESALCGIMGVAKFTNDIPKAISTKDAMFIVGAVQYSATEIAAWMTSRLGEDIDPCEYNFAQVMKKLGIVKLDGSKFIAGNKPSLMILNLELGTFSHEFAHTVERATPGMLEVAKTNFLRLSKEDQDLFNLFMSSQNPDLTFDDRMEEYFAYSLQTDDWREGANRIKLALEEEKQQQTKKRRKQ